jgi:hypothetical protein
VRALGEPGLAAAFELISDELLHHNAALEFGHVPDEKAEGEYGFGQPDIATRVRTVRRLLVPGERVGPDRLVLRPRPPRRVDDHSARAARAGAAALRAAAPGGPTTDASRPPRTT